MEIELAWALTALGGVVTVLITVVVAFWRHLDNRFDKLEAQRERDRAQLEVVEQTLTRRVLDLRVEVYDKFARGDFLNTWRGELQADIRSIFTKLSALSQRLNHLLGQHDRRPYSPADGEE